MRHRTNRYFFCDWNTIKDLKGSPEYVGGVFSVSNNKIESIEGIPKYVGGNFWIRSNPRKFTDNEIRSVCNVKGNVYT